MVYKISTSFFLAFLLFFNDGNAMHISPGVQNFALGSGALIVAGACGLKSYKEFQEGLNDVVDEGVEEVKNSYADLKHSEAVDTGKTFFKNIGNALRGRSQENYTSSTILEIRRQLAYLKNGFVRWKTPIAWGTAATAFGTYGLYAMTAGIVKSPALQDCLAVSSVGGAIVCATKGYNNYSSLSAKKKNVRFKKDKDSPEYSYDNRPFAMKSCFATSAVLSVVGFGLLYKNHR